MPKSWLIVLYERARFQVGVSVMPTYAPLRPSSRADKKLIWSPKKAHRNLEAITGFLQAKRGIFSLQHEVIHPQFALPEGVAEGTEKADLFRLMAALADKQADALEVWERSRQYFSNQSAYDSGFWTKEHLEEWMWEVNPLLLGQKTPPNPAAMIQWFNEQFKPCRNRPADDPPLLSELAESMRRQVPGIGVQIGSAAVMYLAEPRGWQPDDSFRNKVDSNDGWLAFTSGELRVRRGANMPNHSYVNYFLACRLAETADEAGVNKFTYKLARWALMSRHVKTYVYAVSGARREERANIINSIYDGFFGTRLERWVQRTGFYRRSNTLHLSEQLVPLTDIDVDKTLPKPRVYGPRRPQHLAATRGQHVLWH